MSYSSPGPALTRMYESRSVEFHRSSVTSNSAMVTKVLPPSDSKRPASPQKPKLSGRSKRRGSPMKVVTHSGARWWRLLRS